MRLLNGSRVVLCKEVGCITKVGPSGKDASEVGDGKQGEIGVRTIEKEFQESTGFIME